MALDAVTIVGLVLGVLGLFGISLMYNLSKRVWKILAGRISRRRNGARDEEGLPMAFPATQYASAVAINLTTRPINTTPILPIDIVPIGGNTSSGSHVGAARRVGQRNDDSNTTPSTPSLFVNDPNNGRLPITTEQRGGSRPSIVRATAVSSYLAPSARNRHYGQTTSMSPVPIQGSIPVANAPNPRPTLPSIPVPIVSDPTADRLTTVPEEQHAIREDTLTPPEGGRCYPSVPSASSSTILRTDVDLPLPAQVQPSIPTVSVYATEDNELVVLPQESDIQTPAELFSPMSSCLAIGASRPSSSPNNAPIGTSGGLTSHGAIIERDRTENEGPPPRNSTSPLTATPQPQLLPEPQQPLDRASSDSPSTRLPDTVSTTTDSTSSGTSAAAETPLSSVSSGSDRQRQRDRDSQLQPLEDTTAEGEIQLAEGPPEVELVSPKRGPVTGGEHILIVGARFPSMRLYVRFGDAFTPASRKNPTILECTLPPAPRPGVVPVALSRAPDHNAPNFGRSFATFRYEDRRIEALLYLLKLVYEKADGGPLENLVALGQQYLQSVTATPFSQGGINTQAAEVAEAAEDYDNILKAEELEEISIHFLSDYCKTEDWRKTISSCNRHGQTLAHISVMLGYINLLRQLVAWGIDLNLADLQGSTALHYAFLCSKTECATLLILSGANELTLDELGRSPWVLNPSLVDEVTSQLRGMSRIDDRFLVSYHSMDNGCETERPEEASALRAKYLLVERWLQKMEEDQHSTYSLSSDPGPGFWASPAYLSSNLGSVNVSDLATKNPRIAAAHPNQPKGMVPKVPYGPRDQSDLQSSHEISYSYPERDETSSTSPIGSAGVTPPTAKMFVADSPKLDLSIAPSFFPTGFLTGSHQPPVQQALYDPDTIHIVNSPVFKAWYRHRSQYFCYESVYEAAVAFVLEGSPDVVSQLTSGSHSNSSNSAASSSHPNASMWNYPHYDGPVPICRSEGSPVDRWDAVKVQLYGTSGIEEGKNYAGQSILTDWLQQTPNERSWTCKVPLEGSGGHPCGAGFSRRDRAVVHIRARHLDMRPYRCENGGKCQTPNCTKAFTSKENRSEHWNPKKITCTRCGKVEMRQNVARHAQRCPGPRA